MIPNLIAELEDYTEYEILNPNVVDDDLGGQETVWVPGAHFNAAVILDDSIEMRVAESQGIKGNYTVAVQKSVRLPWHTVFRRVSDGAVYRVTTKDDFAPPNRSMIDLRSIIAEEWKIPHDERIRSS